MSNAQKFLSGIIAIGVITAMVLPGRQTVAVLGGVTNLVKGTESTAITGHL
jgi:hypothetical protein